MIGTVHDPSQDNPALIYCDGSIERIRKIGRVMIVIPCLDYGLIERFYDNLTRADGSENSLYAEQVAIKRADEIRAKKVSEIHPEFLILSDNYTAIERTGIQNAAHIVPQSFHYADAYLKKIVQRLGYLRRSSGRVTRRKPFTPSQLEITSLGKTERNEFQLSESPMYSEFRILSQESVYPTRFNVVKVRPISSVPEAC